MEYSAVAYLHDSFAVELTIASPYGSEFGFDTTGQEEVVVWNLYYGNMTAARKTVDHILSYMRSSPTWAYHGGARSWGDAGNNAKWLGAFGTGFDDRGQMHYRSGLNMIPLIEVRHLDSFPHESCCSTTGLIPTRCSYLRWQWEQYQAS